MKDSFKIEVRLGDRVIYGTRTLSTPVYVIGAVSKIYDHVPRPERSYSPPDRVAVHVEFISSGRMPDKDPIVYASNVVKVSDWWVSHGVGQ